MIQFIYLFCTSFISLLIYMNFFNKNKEKNNIHLITYYFLSVLVNFLLMAGLLFVVMKRDSYGDTMAFNLKYILLSSVIAVHMPLLFEVIKFCCKKLLRWYFNLYKKLGEFIIKFFEKSRNKILSLKVVKKGIRYYKNNEKQIKKNCLFIGLVMLLFLFFDFVLRCYVYADIRFYLPIMPTPNLLTIAYGLLTGVILVLLPKKLVKVLYPLVYIYLLIMFVVNYMLLQIKNDAFTVYNLQVAGEGFEFFEFVAAEINLLFIIILVISLIIFISTFKQIKNIYCDIKVWKRIGIVLLTVLTFFGLRFISVNIMRSDDRGGWDDFSFPKYYTYHLINSRKNVSVLGLYEYGVKDIVNYIKNATTKIGTIEEIEQTIKDNNDDKENEMSGIFKGKNLIMIMMESIDFVHVNEKTMPTLSMMLENGLNFSKRYNHLGAGSSTIGTEFASLSGLFYMSDNKYDVNSYKQAIPAVFSRNGYETASFHENNGVYYNRSQLHKSLGFDNSYFLLDMNVKDFQWYVDKQFFTNSEIYDLVVHKGSDKPFMSYIITISGHGTYDNKNQFCNDEGISNEQECIKHLFGRTDEMLKEMLDRLEKDGILDDTVIVLYSDHSAYSYNYSEEELKNTYVNIDGNYGIKNLPFVIYSTDIDGKTYDDIVVNDMDMGPTLFNMFGIDYDGKYYVGTDIFDDDRVNVAMFTDYSWYDGNIYNLTAEQTDYVKKMNSYVRKRREFSNMLISHDYYKNFE